MAGKFSSREVICLMIFSSSRMSYFIHFALGVITHLTSYWNSSPTITDSIRNAVNAMEHLSLENRPTAGGGRRSTIRDDTGVGGGGATGGPETSIPDNLINDR